MAVTRLSFAAVLLASSLFVGGVAKADSIDVIGADGSSVGTLTYAGSGTLFGYITQFGGTDLSCAGYSPNACTPVGDNDFSPPPPTKKEVDDGKVYLSDGPFTTSSLYATAFDYLKDAVDGMLSSGSNLANEPATLQVLAGVSLTPVKNEDGEDIFSISSQYFSIKFGDQWAFFKNTGGTLNLEWDGDNGISHFTQYVPGPIVGAGLPGLVVAFGALVVLARRRRKFAY